MIWKNKVQKNYDFYLGTSSMIGSLTGQGAAKTKTKSQTQLVHSFCQKHLIIFLAIPHLHPMLNLRNPITSLFVTFEANRNHKIGP